MKGLSEFITEAKGSDFNKFQEILNNNRIGMIGPNAKGEVYIVPAKFKFSKVCMYPSICIKFKNDSNGIPGGWIPFDKEVDTVMPIVTNVTNEGNKNHKEVDVKDKLDKNKKNEYYEFSEKNANFIVDELRNI